MTNPWKEKSTLEGLYHDQQMTLEEIAEKYDKSDTTILYWMRKHGIEREDRSTRIKKAYRYKAPYYGTGTQGYERWEIRTPDGKAVPRVHQLLLIADGVDPHKVFDPDTDIHHQNGVRWDNRPDNLELVDHADHASHHGKLSEEERQEIIERCGQEDITKTALGEEYGVTIQAVNHLLNRSRTGEDC